ncbi:MAG TPA: cyclic nucleotide-binding domain-containing protein [Terriglobales bacterium]|nr:cyclic nucleotide-binding domain-containing protein [Terriglobales bacterium]
MTTSTTLRDAAGLNVLDKMKSLRRAQIFAYCTTEQLLKIAGIAQEVRFAAGEDIFRENDPGDALFQIVSGRVRLSKPAADFEAVRTEDETFGTLAILDRSERESNATAEEDTLALRIDAAEFLEVLAENPEIVQGLFSALTREIRDYRYGYLRG